MFLVYCFLFMVASKAYLSQNSWQFQKCKGFKTLGLTKNKKL